ncbi:MAG: hypothetical protein AAB478_04670 [Patescibacteria group bacterium]
MLEKEYKYYKDNQKDFLSKYKGKVLVIKEEKLIGVYDDEAVAYDATVSVHPLGTFLIQRCVPDNETVQSFHSRVIFS